MEKTTKKCLNKLSRAPTMVGSRRRWWVAEDDCKRSDYRNCQLDKGQKCLDDFSSTSYLKGMSTKTDLCEDVNTIKDALEVSFLAVFLNMK